MKIGILTLTPNCNYGGILQAYALQKVLEEHNHDACVINWQQRVIPRYQWPLIYLKRIIRKYILRRLTYLNVEQAQKGNLRKFISSNINLTKEKVFTTQDFSKLKKLRLDAIVVGSDQIWRPAYSPNIYDSFLSFAGDWNIKKVSYAASFGTSEWEFSIEQEENCKKLAQKFNALSVREDSALNLCQDKLNVNAKHVLDPCLLLNKKHYENLLGERETTAKSNQLCQYFLDNTQYKIQVAKKLSIYHSKEIYQPYSGVKDTSLPIDKRVYPKISDWLHIFYDSEFVITDSFHGCVFCILFNREFIAIANEKRGVTRFTSLFKMFALEDRLFFDNGELPDFASINKIDWNKVNTILTEQRQLSNNFLSSALGEK